MSRIDCVLPIRSASSRRVSLPVVSALALLLLTAGLASAVTVPERSGVGEKEFRLAELEISALLRLPSELPAGMGAALAAEDLAALGLPADHGRLDARGGRWATLLLSQPMVPGSGDGNELTWRGLEPANEGALRAAIDRAVRSYLRANAAQLRLDIGELAGSRVTVYEGGVVAQVYIPRVVEGVPVRDSYLTAVVNHGNLVLFGAHQWGDVSVPTTPRLSAEKARSVVAVHVEPFVPDAWKKEQLVLVPTARGDQMKRSRPGQGYGHRLAWVLRPTFVDDMGGWEASVDAHTGELLSFEDTNHYAEVRGGVYPVSNDGVVPDGVEQAGWPMPFDILSTAGGPVTTDSGGNFIAAAGNRTSNLSGQYVTMNDNCGAISLTTTGDIDFGTSVGTDCATPGVGGAGNTHASRSGFHELNRVIEMARGQLPGNLWLQALLTANMNLPSTCNAFWNGTVNFYRSGGGCSNTGEIAGIFDHEWGHGMDANDATPGIASPSGEGIADIYTALRLNDSCIGRNFRPGVVCGGYGDPCTVCTGVRDIDYLKRVSGMPHDYTWRNANCGGGVHCSGYVYSEAVWSLWKRILQAAPYSYDNNTAHEIVTRLTFIGAGNTGTWYSGAPPFGGCGAGSGYLNYLAADDDNGNLADGTPHMAGIFQAFDDQEIACNTPAVTDFGCAGTPTTAPVVVGTPQNQAAGLSWGAVAGATEYEIFRTDNVFSCDFGKVKVGTTAGTTFNDSGLQNGRPYSYVVIPKGSTDSCFGPASACTTVIPAAGPDMAVDESSTSFSPTSGDGDQFLDNCESADIAFVVNNTGIGPLTNPRILGVVPSNPGVMITTVFPEPIFPPSIPEASGGLGEFSLVGGGLTPGETLTLQVEVTADELAGSSRFGNLVLSSAESDLTLFPSLTYTFETDPDGWTTVQGTFARDNDAGVGGADGTTWYQQSSANLDNQCDQIQSPVFVPEATTTLSLWNNFDIEPIFGTTWYDRANVGIVDAGGTRSPVNPDSGRLYNASGANGNCGTTGQAGWAASSPTWATSGWSAAALGSAGLAGQEVQLDIRYGTDFILNGDGFRFDEVTLTDVSILVPDVQPDVCVECTVDADCDNGLFCDGAEVCNAGSCEAGTPPNCVDGVSCTIDSCNEGTDTCDNTPTNALCDDGLFCNGAEICDATLDCQAGSDPCPPGQTCDEVGDICLACDETLALPQGVPSGGGWVLMSLPCDPGVNDTVADICGDDLAGVYGTDWIMYERQEEFGTYAPLTLGTSLNVGEGYWIKTLLAGQSISMAGADNPGAFYPLTGFNLAPPNGCAGSAGICNLVGHRYDFNVCWADVLVIDGGLPLLLGEADPGGICQTVGGPTCIMSRIAHKWTGGSFAPFDGQTPGMEGTLTPWDGFWVSANKTGIQLEISPVVNSCGPPLAAGPVEGDEQTGWFGRLIVESNGLVDSSNVFGELSDSVDGYDSHDLAELDPFGDEYLTLVFPHPEWGEQAGDYSSDYREFGAHRTQAWNFRVKSSDAGAEVVLRWEGAPADLERATLMDVETGVEILPAEEGSYVFTMTGATRDFVWLVR